MEDENTETIQQESLDLIESSQNVEESNETHEAENTAETTAEPSEPEKTNDQSVPAAATEKTHKFPLGRIKHMMKMDPDVNMASQESVFLVTKSLEMFIENLAIEAYSYTSQSKKKTVSKQDVEKAIDAVDALAFLDGALDD